MRPLRRAQVGLDVWICARHGGAGEHETLEPAAWDASAGLVTINPLAAWDEAAVWDYVRAHDVPYNPLHAQGYRHHRLCALLEPGTRGVTAGGGPELRPPPPRSCGRRPVRRTMQSRYSSIPRIAID